MLSELIRVGVVTGINPEKGTVRVHLVGVDEEVSYELPVIYPKTHKDKAYFMPDIGEQVVCIFSGQGLEQGFVLGAIYSEADTTPVSNKDKFFIRFEDGTEIEYDRQAHKLRISVRGDVLIEADGNMTLKASRIDLNP
jgi:phage baseplate assembly protein V